MVSRLSGGQEIAGPTPATLTRAIEGDRKRILHAGRRPVPRQSKHGSRSPLGCPLGSVAQQEERLHDMQKVAGSRPAVPTPVIDLKQAEAVS